MLVTRRTFLKSTGAMLTLIAARRGLAQPAGAVAPALIVLPSTTLPLQFRVAGRWRRGADARDFFPGGVPVRVVRALDGLDLTFERLSVDRKEFLAVRFNPQQLAEEAIPWPVGGVNLPLRGDYSGPSRLVFKLTLGWWESIVNRRLDLATLLNWSDLPPSLAPNALPTDAPFPNPNARPDEKFLVADQFTAIELPLGMLLSPHEGEVWENPIFPVASINFPSDLRRYLPWRTKLAHKPKKDASGKMKRPTGPLHVRAIGKTDKDSPPLHLPSNGHQREALVVETSDFNAILPNGPKPVEVDPLMLSGRGAYAKLKVGWTLEELPRTAASRPPFDRVSLDINGWSEETIWGSNQFAEVSKILYSLPFGHAISYVELNKRIVASSAGLSWQMEGQPLTSPVALEERKNFTRLIERDRPIPDPRDVGKARGFCFKRVTLEPFESPPLEPIPDATLDGWMKLAVTKEIFTYKITAWDWDDHKIEFDLPLYFVSKDLAEKGNQGDTTLREAVDRYLHSDFKQLREADIKGQKISYAPSRQEKDLGIETHTLEFSALMNADGSPFSSDPKIWRVRFFPSVELSQVRLAEAAAFDRTGSPNTSTGLVYHQDYVDLGWGHANTKNEVFAHLSPPKDKKGLDFSGDKSGGLSTPSFDIVAYSRIFGPVGAGMANPAVGIQRAADAKLRFDPENFFGGLGKLVGGIDLKEVIEVIDEAANEIEKVPQLVAEATEDIRKVIEIEDANQAVNILRTFKDQLLASPGDEAVQKIRAMVAQAREAFESAAQNYRQELATIVLGAIRPGEHILKALAVAAETKAIERFEAITKAQVEAIRAAAAAIPLDAARAIAMSAPAQAAELISSAFQKNVEEKFKVIGDDLRKLVETNDFARILSTIGAGDQILSELALVVEEKARAVHGTISAAEVEAIRQALAALPLEAARAVIMSDPARAANLIANAFGNKIQARFKPIAEDLRRLVETNDFVRIMRGISSVPSTGVLIEFFLLEARTKLDRELSGRLDQRHWQEIEALLRNPEVIIEISAAWRDVSKIATQMEKVWKHTLRDLQADLRTQVHDILFQTLNSDFATQLKDHKKSLQQLRETIEALERTPLEKTVAQALDMGRLLEQLEAPVTRVEATLISLKEFPFKPLWQIAEIIKEAIEQIQNDPKALLPRLPSLINRLQASVDSLDPQTGSELRAVTAAANQFATEANQATALLDAKAIEFTKAASDLTNPAAQLLLQQEAAAVLLKKELLNKIDALSKLALPQIQQWQDLYASAKAQLAATIEPVKNFLNKLNQQIEDLKEKLPKELSVGYSWNPRLKSGGPFVASRGGVAASFVLTAKIRKSLKLEEINAPPCMEIDGRLKDFQLVLIPSFRAIIVSFKEVSFVSRNGGAPKVEVKIGRVEFAEALKFVQELARALSPKSGFFLQFNDLGLEAGYRFALPNITSGGFNLIQVSINTSVILPFDGSPVRLKFSLSERNRPFLLSVGIFGGGGYFAITLNSSSGGIEKIEGSLEFGVVAALDIAFASGVVSITAGIYYESSNDGNTVFTGFFKAVGVLNVIALIDIAALFYLGLSYEKRDGRSLAVGEAIVSVEIEMLFLSVSVELRCRKEMEGSSDTPQSAPSSSSHVALAGELASAWTTAPTVGQRPSLKQDRLRRNRSHRRSWQHYRSKFAQN